MELTIDYCRNCGYRQEAQEALEDLLENFEDDIDSFRIVPSEGGIFRISIDGQVVFDPEQIDFSSDKTVAKVEGFLEK